MGGLVVGFGDTAVGPPGNDDRLMYMAGNGQLYFGIALNQTVHTSTKYNDGSWHLVDASLSSAGLALYVDGALVATNPTSRSRRTTTAIGESETRASGVGAAT
jgi:hypothetical protein